MNSVIMNHGKISWLYLILRTFDFLKVLREVAYTITITCWFYTFQKLVKEKIALKQDNVKFLCIYFCVKRVSI